MPERPPTINERAVAALRRVESSSVDAVGYDPATAKLYIRFRGSGRAYVYADVPPAVYEALIAADSIGRFVNAEIKGTYNFRPL